MKTKMRTKYVILPCLPFPLFLPILLFIPLLTACKEPKEEPILSARPVKTTTVVPQSLISKDFAGRIEAVEYVKLAFRVNGQIMEIPVVEGQRIKKGQLIAALDPQDIQLQYAARRSAYETAAAELERNRRLLAKEAISAQEYEISQSRFQQAKSAYELSSNNLLQTKLLAPFDGSIEKKLVEKYQRVQMGEGIAQLVNTDKLRIKFTVPNNYLYLLRTPHNQYTVEFDTYKGHRFRAQLEEYLDMSTHGAGIPVSLRINDPQFHKDSLAIKPGFTCNVHFTVPIGPLTDNNWCLIPMSAVFSENEGNATYVWKVEDQRVHKQRIETHAPTGHAEVIVTRGLKAGDRIVTAGVYQLVEGEKVKELTNYPLS